METFSIVLVLLVVTRLFGIVAKKLNQPILVGELVAGIVVGLVAENALNWNFSHNEQFTALTDLGIFFLMLLGGVELRPRELFESGLRSSTIALTAMLLPLVGGMALAWYWLPESHLRFAQSLFVGTALSITAVPVTIKVLLDMHLLKSAIGKLIVSAALVDDLLSLVLLSVLTAIIHTSDLPNGFDLISKILNVVIFLTIVSFIGRKVMPCLARVVDKLGVEEMEFSFLLVMGFAFSILAEILSLHFLLGAFAAGLFFGQHTVNEEVYEDLRKKVTAITAGFFAPIFFASIGLELELSAVIETPFFLCSLLLIAFLGKLIGAALPALAFGMPQRDAWAIGTAMSARGAVELIIAGIALKAGLFDMGEESHPIVDNLFSAIVIVAMLTTIIAPIGLRLILSNLHTQSVREDRGT